MGRKSDQGNGEIGRKIGTLKKGGRDPDSTKVSSGFYLCAKFRRQRLEILRGDKKRNNVIDILKAGGTRISLFLLLNDILVLTKNQA